MSDLNWEVAARTQEASLSHRSSPWGGHLIRFESKNLFIEHAPERSCDLFVRPEIRGTSCEDESLKIKVKLLETYAPGDTLVERSTTMWIFRIGSVLFGNSVGPFANSFFYDQQPILARHQLRRDFPEHGDCAYAVFQDYHGTGQDGILIARKEGGTSSFRTVLVFSTPEDKWPYWASPLFRFLAEAARLAMARFLNRGAVRKMRLRDARLYMVLGMRSFNRGPPLLPDKQDYTESETTSSIERITISAKTSRGWTLWARSKEKRFSLAAYMRDFMAALEHDIPVYESLEGRSLVQYQCVVLRSDWEQVRASFMEAFSIQKAAYRHANGGTTAPSLVEDARPVLIATIARCPCSTSDQGEDVKTVVRKTFVELDEISEYPTMKRSKSDFGGFHV